MNRSIQFTLILLLLGIGSCAGSSEHGDTGGQNEATVRTVDLLPEEFRKAMNEGQAVLIDVRTPGEVARGKIGNSRNIDWMDSDHATTFASLDPDRPVLLYCQAGGRSKQALEYLQSKGFKDVRHLEGGFAAWENAGFPVAH